VITTDRYIQQKRLKAAEADLRSNETGMEEPITQGIQWISIDQKSNSTRPYMEVVVQYREANGKTTPVHFRGAITNNGGKGSSATLIPVRAMTPGLQPVRAKTTTTTQTPQTTASAQSIPGLASIQVQCTGSDCSKADVSFMDENNQKMAAAIVRRQESSVDLKTVGLQAPLSTTSSAKEERKLQIVTNSVEVVHGRTAIEITEQNSTNPLKLKGEIVETNNGRVPMVSNRSDIRANLIGNSREGQIVVELEKVEPQDISAPNLERPTVTIPESNNKPPQTKPSNSTLPATAPATKPGIKPTPVATINQPSVPARPATNPVAPPARSFIIIGGDGPKAQGLPTFDLCPNVPKGNSSASKSIREACEHTFWTNRPEFTTTLAQTTKSKPVGAKSFFIEGGVDKKSFEGFLSLFTGASQDPRQSHFSLLADLLKRIQLSVAWSFVPYVETRFNTLAARIEGPATETGERAGGVFQFMPGTAKLYGISFEDRFNFTKAAPAAANFMNKIEQHQNGDFLLAVASYNRGEYGIDMDEEQANNALNSAKNSNGFNQESLKDFTSDWWKILHFNMAPKQTQHYVIRVVTGIIFGMNPEKYGLTTKPISID
jgi:hypothetical protein